MSNITMFFYSFDVLPENERDFNDYMNNYGNPIMSKYCKNWRLFKQNTILTGDNVSQYIGYFEIPNIDEFLKGEALEEMKETIDQASKVSSNIREWVGEQIASNI